MEFNQEKVNEMASQYVNEALATFELFAETPQDMLGEDETEYSVVLGTITNYDQGGNDKEALQWFSDLVVGLDEEIATITNEGVKETLDKVTDDVADALNQTPEAQAESVEFSYESFDGSLWFVASIKREIYDAKHPKPEPKESEETTEFTETEPTE